MSKFYVGQRVRILWSRHWPELAGEVGTIVSRSIGCGVTGSSEWNVAPDCWGSHVCPSGDQAGDIFGPGSDQLAPAYDGNEKVSWESCLWQPSPERVA